VSSAQELYFSVGSAGAGFRKPSGATANGRLCDRTPSRSANAGIAERDRWDDEHLALTGDAHDLPATPMDVIVMLEAEQDVGALLGHPPCAQWTTWWISVQRTWRRHLGHTQPRSRCSTLMRVAVAGTRRARPTSTTSESGPSRIRHTFAEQARRWTATDERGTQPSISAAGAPGAPMSVSRVVVTCRCGTWQCVAPLAAGVQRVRGHLHEGIGQAAPSRAIVIRSQPARQRLERGAQSGAADVVDEALHPDAAVVAAQRSHLEETFVGALLLAPLEGGGIDGVARMGAVATELVGALRLCPAQQPELVDLGTRLLNGLGRPGEQDQMGEADPAGAHRLDAVLQRVRLVADADCGAGFAGRHVALVGEPGDRSREALALPLITGRELRRVAGKIQAQRVDEHLCADDRVSDVEGRAHRGPGACAEALDGCVQLIEGIGIATWLTHRCIY
jgi:hypothetical protein